MDIYDMRRAIVANLIGTKVASKAELSRLSGLSPSYVTRMLSAPGTEGHKRIGEETCLTLEAIAQLELAPGQLLDPKPIERAAKNQKRREPTDSEWTYLMNLRDMSDEDKQKSQQEAEERSKRFRAVRKQILADHGIHGEADPDSVERALGGVPKGPTPAPPSSAYSRREAGTPSRSRPSEKIKSAKAK